MSTVHRILLIAFARSDRPIAGRRRAAGVAAASRQSLGSEVLTCTPWAGLYIEGPCASPAEVRHDALAPEGKA